MASDGSGATSDCDAPLLPRDSGQCASAMTCNVIVAVLTMTIVEPAGPTAPLELPEPVSLHSTSAPAPEPPPPRA